MEHMTHFNNLNIIIKKIHYPTFWELNIVSLCLHFLVCYFIYLYVYYVLN